MIFLRLLAAMALTLAGGCSAAHGDAAARINHWNALLSKELPIGTQKADVEAFFSRNKLESSFSATEHAIIAIDRDVQTGGLVSTSITFRCLLDSAQRLQSCNTSLASTGP